MSWGSEARQRPTRGSKNVIFLTVPCQQEVKMVMKFTFWRFLLVYWLSDTIRGLVMMRSVVHWRRHSTRTWFSTEHLQRHCGASGCGTVLFHSVASMLSKSSNFASFIDIFSLVCAMTVKWKMSLDLTLGVCLGVIARGCPRGEDGGSRLRLWVHLGGL